MKSRPIQAKAHEVRAILSGNQTQIRRSMRHQPFDDWSPSHYTELHGYDKDGALTPEKVIGWGVVNYDGERGYKSPYGRPGDQLWVRETWRETSDALAWHYAADLTILPKLSDKQLAAFLAPLTWESYKWKPSIHMPRWASRITLEITGVRVERLQDISEVDAVAEGCKASSTALSSDWQYDTFAKDAYRDLWESINGPGSWDTNPWVWVIEFKRIAP